MSDLNIRRTFKELFEGNPQYYGNCSGPTPLSAPTTGVDHWAGHLFFDYPIGIYPIWEGSVRWGCVDIDEGHLDSQIHAQNLSAVLREFGIWGWPEKSKSKGYHVWVFTSECSAQLMRHALKAACAIAGAPDKEVNPKQSSLLPGQLGNFVRLPYPKVNTDSQYVLDKGVLRLDRDQFVTAALGARSPVVLLQELANLYTPPRRPPIEKRLVTGFNGPIGYRERMTGLTWTIYNDGPLEGSDRSGTMFKLACRLRDEGFTTGETFELLSDYDYRHGKFSGRPDRDQRLEDLVQRAFT